MPSDNDAPSISHHTKKKRFEDDSLSPDVGQKPIQLQRRRVWRACECCRRKKIKCDGCEPTCSQCATSGSQCTWLQTKDRAALSRHYVQELEARLLHMESLFTQITPVLEQLGHSVDGVNVAGSSSNITGPAPTSILQTMVPKDVSPAGSSPSPISPIKIEDDVSESLGQLALDEHGHMRWIGGSSTMSLIQSFRALTTSPLHRISPMEEDPRAPGPSVNKLYFPASVFFGKVHALPGPEEAEFPDRDLADKLVEAYFLRFHFLMPVLDKPSFLRQYNLLMDNLHDISLARTQTPFMALVFAVFACAAKLIEDPRLVGVLSQDEGGMGMVYYERALVLQYISHSHTQPAQVQCFLLLASFLCSVNCLPQAWILVGQAVRVGQDLGLHRSPRRLTVTSIEKETRRKIWWGVYTLDRMLALALGRPLGVEDSDCDVEYPVDIDDENLPEYFSGASVSHRRPSLMTGSIALSALYKIAGQVLRKVYAIDKCKEHLEPEKKVELQATVESLDSELSKWCEELPAIFKSAPSTEEQVSMGAVLCSHYYSVLTTLHRNFIPVKRDQSLMTAKSTMKAVSSARSCTRLAPSIKNVVPPSHHLAFFIQHLFSSAVILLLYAMHAPDPRATVPAMEEAKSTLVALESWEGHWPGARKCKELLIELANTATDAINEAAARGARKTDELPMTSPTHTVSPANLERRRSVTITTQQGSVPGRVVKTKPRRPQSRDPNPSARRAAAASPYRVDSAAQRARSTSRRRGHDEADGLDRTGRHMSSYYAPFSTSNAGRSNISPNSSPASVNLPSPAAQVDSPKENSPRMSAVGPSYAIPVSPVSPVLVPSPPRYDYDVGMAVGKSNALWNGSNGERRSLDMYPPNPSLSYPGTYSSAPSSFMDSNYLSYEPSSSDMGLYPSLSTTPPSSSFAAQGLPFRGLDYIRNYNSGLYSPTGDQELWQSFDPGAFGYDPELPFVLGDLTVEGQE